MFHATFAYINIIIEVTFIYEEMRNTQRNSPDVSHWKILSHKSVSSAFRYEPDSNPQH
jgi:hypothetical protein